MTNLINQTVLMSGVDYFDDTAAINPFMDETLSVDRAKAADEHIQIKNALQEAGVTVIQVNPPTDCQDGVYTANWALVRGDKAVMSNLPNAREGEMPYAEQILRIQGKQIFHVPDELRFSGQGDALPCGNFLFCGSGYRSDPAAHQYAANILGYEIIQLQTIPQLDEAGHPVINSFSGWADSPFYDIDLAISILRAPTDTQKGLIAWCPDAFLPESRAKLAAFDGVDKITVSLKEAYDSFACNLVSTGETVVMGKHAPELQAAIEAAGLKTITPEITELTKGGGYIRCTTLTLDTI